MTNTEKPTALAKLLAPHLNAEKVVQEAGFAPDYKGTPANSIDLLWKRGTTRVRLAEALAIVEAENA